MSGLLGHSMGERTEERQCLLQRMYPVLSDTGHSQEPWIEDRHTTEPSYDRNVVRPLLTNTLSKKQT